MQDAPRGFRLSPQQRRRWHARQGGSIECAQCAVALEGPLDAVRLRAALQSIVDRHEILRTTFRRAPGLGAPIQVIERRGTFTWRKLAGDAPVAVDPAADPLADPFVDRLLDDDRRAPFDLEAGPMLRVSLLSSGRTHVLALTLPALCADRRTLANLLRELCGAYGGGGDASAGDVVQYVEYAEWQHQLLDGADAAEGLAFWRQRRAPPDRELGLPGERRAEEGPLAPAPVGARLASEAAARLEGIARDRGVPREVPLLAALGVLLWRFTGSTDVLVGCVVDGRRDPELQGGLGPFARTLPIGCRLDPRRPFRELVHQLAQAYRAAHDLQEYQIDPADPAAPAPPVCFEADRTDLPAAMGELRLTGVRQHAHVDRCTLKLSCTRTADALALTFHHREAALPRGIVEALCRAFVALLDRIADDPDRRVEALELLDGAVRRRVIVAWNATAVARADARCLHEAFAAQAAREPARVAVEQGAAALTYGALNRRANRVAHQLRGLGVGPEVVVGLCLPRSPELVVALLAVLKAGGAYLPLDPGQPAARLRRMVADARP
ncbi:MAG TPA: condensation domain-containing protein, partial [Myxococcota bacterium]|nr:condensation domain-containing protein [Myxococcota bacterium]